MNYRKLRNPETEANREDGTPRGVQGGPRDAQGGRARRGHAQGVPKGGKEGLNQGAQGGNQGRLGPRGAQRGAKGI